MTSRFSTQNSHSIGEKPQLAAIPRYLSAIVSQGLVSGFHFVLNLMLVRLLSLADFGIFALTFVLAIMASSVGNALISTPLCVYAPASKNAAERTAMESMLSTLMMALLGTAAALGVLLSLGAVNTGLDLNVLLAAVGFVIAYLARQYSRSFGYARFDVIAVLFGDMVYVTIGALAIGGLLLLGHSITSVEVFTALSIANCIAVMVEISRLPSPVKLQSLGKAIRGYSDIWLQSRWALVGAVTTVVVSQAHSLVVSTLKSPAAYAPLAAGFVLFGPVRVVFTTIQNVMKPEMSRAIARHRSGDARRQMLMASGLSVLAVAALVLLMLLLWPWLDAWLYQEKYADSPMRHIVLMWAAITLVSAVQNGPFAALQSLRAFRELAMVTVYGSILSITLVSIILYTSPIQWSIGGILLAEAFVAGWVVALSLQRFRRELIPAETVHS